MRFNRPRAFRYMREYGLDALIATSATNITYFTGYYCFSDDKMREFMMSPGASSNLTHHMYAVFPIKGDPVLVMSQLMAVNAADLWVRDLRTFGGGSLDSSIPSSESHEAYRHVDTAVRASPRAETATDALLGALSDLGLSEARIGLEMEGLPPERREAVLEGLPDASVGDCTNLIRLLRAVKSPEEIITLTRATEIGESAAMRSLAMARPGLHFAEIIQRYRELVAERGADVDHFLFGIDGLGIASEPDYILRENDVMYTDFGCNYQRYYSDAGATLVVGEISGALRERYNATQAAMEAATSLARPGVKASWVQAMMKRVTDEHGMTCFPHGHGVGLEIRDYPILVPDNGLRIRDDFVDVTSDLELEPGMVFSLEIGVFMPGVGSLQNEQTFVITETGCRPLARQDRAKPVRILL